jgi:hypothetical protein
MNAAQISEEGIIATFVSSAEYFQNPSLGNNNNATWLEKAYQDLLGRTTAGDATAASFLAGLNAGTLTRSQITATLVRSDEFLLHVVFANYADLFDRAPVASPDPALSEFLPWLPTLRQTSFPVGGPTPDQQFINALLGSVEYLQHVGNTTRDWASSLYTRVLNRTTVNPNGAEVNNVVAGVINGYAATRHGVATAIAASVEHKNRLVADYYETYLRRSAAPSEITAWANQLFVLRDENVLAAIVSSQEYFPLSGPSSSNAGWVAKVYNDLLKRSSAGDAGATNFVNQLNVVPPAQLGASRGSVAFQLLVSGEYRRLLVASFFNKYLGRNKPIPPSPGDVELNPWVNLLAAGATQEQIIANMLASAEYYLRPHDLP